MFPVAFCLFSGKVRPVSDIDDRQVGIGNSVYPYMKHQPLLFRKTFVKFVNFLHDKFHLL